jgi:hypothetical protein
MLYSHLEVANEVMECSDKVDTAPKKCHLSVQLYLWSLMDKFFDISYLRGKWAEINFIKILKFWIINNKN